MDSVAGKTGVVTLVKADVGLENVDNTSDMTKPISTATQTALDNKVDKETGKSLTTNDFTTVLKDKLDGLTSYVHPITAGNLHIPAGGATGQILKWSADGTAIWGDETGGGGGGEATLPTFTVVPGNVTGSAIAIHAQISDFGGFNPETTQYRVLANGVEKVGWTTKSDSAEFIIDVAGLSATTVYAIEVIVRDETSPSKNTKSATVAGETTEPTGTQKAIMGFGIAGSSNTNRTNIINSAGVVANDVVNTPQQQEDYQQ